MTIRWQEHTGIYESAYFGLRNWWLLIGCNETPTRLRDVCMKVHTVLKLIIISKGRLLFRNWCIFCIILEFVCRSHKFYRAELQKR